MASQTAEKGTVMVLNGEERFALAIVRDLHKKNIRVVVGGNRKYSRCFYSRYATKRFYYPPVELGFEGAHNQILNYVKKYKPTVLFPASLDTYYLILKYRSEYEQHTSLIPMPNYEEFCRIDNKEFQIKLAKKYKIPLPRTHFPKTIDNIKKISNEITYPVLLKPLVSASGYRIRYVTNASQLIEEYNRFKLEKKLKFYTKNTFLIQDYIPVNSKYSICYHPGKDSFVFQHNHQHVTVYVLFDHGNLVGLFANTYEDPTCPMLFNSHYTTVSIKNEELTEQTVKLFKGIKFHGCASVQYLLDQRDNTYKFIEINPRIWGSLESAIKAGIDFPFLMYQIALGKKPKPLWDYKEGLKFKWLICGEMYRLIKSENKLKLFTNLFNPDTNWEFSIKDPFPHIIHFINLAPHLWRGILRK